MSDEELLFLYHKYKKRRLIFILFISLLIIILLLFYFKVSNNSLSNEKQYPEIIPLQKDKIAPEIKLNMQNIEIFEDDSIDYLKYIDSVLDDVDGNLFDRLSYKKIDTSMIGNQKIIYSVSDNSGNSTQAVLLVNVLKKQTIEENNPPSQPPKKEENNSSANKGNSSVTEAPSNDVIIPKPNPPTDNTEKPSLDKVIKYFLFSDGYTMSNVADACASELRRINKTGICSPIQNENGIYLGMKLELEN